MSEIPIEVAVRVRPLVGNEQPQNADPSLLCDVEESAVVIGKDKQFQFDYVFDQKANQLDVYKATVAPLVKLYLDGYNTTVFAYGHTGTGKTFTMGTGNYVFLNEVEMGIIPRAVADIFNYKADIEKNIVCKLSVSFIEIYCEETTDLLANDSKALQIREDEAGNTVIVGVTEEPAVSLEHVLELLDAGTTMRHVGATNVNRVSSRSHCIFTMSLEQYSIDDADHSTPGTILTSRFHFVDLAGSERAHRTGNRGERFKESISINSGLLALGNVIGALSDTRRKHSHVPYRESKLTRLLKDSLGGNSRTLMIACLSPVLADLDENINSLKYASRAQKIKNRPILNLDREGTKIARMEKEIHALRTQLQYRQSDQSEHIKLTSVELERLKQQHLQNERRNNEEASRKHLQEVNAIIHAIETSCNLSPSFKGQIDRWRKSWHGLQLEYRPISAPSRSSTHRLEGVDSDENLTSQIAKYKQHESDWEIVVEKKTQELDELRQEVIAFGEENARLRLELDVAINNANEFKERLYEQQIEMQHLRSHAGSNARRHSKEERPAYVQQDRLMQRFRARNDVLMSQIDDMDHVVHDEDISSEEDDSDNVVPNLNERRKNFLPDMKLKSSIPVRINSYSNSRRGSKLQTTDTNSINPIRQNDRDALSRLESSRESFIMGAKAAELNVREVATRMRELETNIHEKEKLIAELLQSEQQAKATSVIYCEKLSKLQREYEKSRKDLEDATKVMQNSTNGDDTVKDSTQYTKLDTEYKKKLKTVQKNLNTFKRKETATNRINTLQKNNEKRIKDLEANIARMRNHHSELERKLKRETDKKAKYEQETRKNELRIKELELKTDQQQKILKRKNEEVVAAQRKLRTTDQKVNEELEKKKQWIENEIENILSRQKDIAFLEAELRDRDITLRKKEALSKEKDLLEIKKSKSSMTLSKDIVKLSVKMDTVDEKIEEYITSGGDSTQLQNVKSDLVMQKEQLEQLIERGGLEATEERRLIELGEALETVQEAIQYKNDLIEQRQLTMAGDDLDNYRNVEVLLNNMGELSTTEYKHLLGKFFLKIIELRASTRDADETRFHFEMKISNQEKKILDLQHVINVIETRFERSTTDLLSKHEQEVQFLMTQLNNEECYHGNSENNNDELENRVKHLEKELYFYKIKSRKYKDRLRGFSQNLSIDTENDGPLTTEVASNFYRHPRSRQPVETLPVDNTEGVYFPPVRNPGWVVDQKNSEKRLNPINSNTQPDEAKRIQDIFESKLPGARSVKKRDSVLKRSATEDLSYADSIEVISKNPWH